MQQFTCKEPKETYCFRECARRYVLTGRSLADMCDHNAAVAKDLKRQHVSLIWSIVKTLYSSKVGEYNQATPPGNLSRDESVPGVGGVGVGPSGGVGGGGESLAGTGIDGDQRSLLGAGGDTPGAPMSGDDETETDETPEQHLNGHVGHLVGGMTFPAQGDFLFGDGELDPLSVDFDRFGLNGGTFVGTNTTLDMQQQDWTLPSEAFPLRHEIQDRSPPPEQFPNHGSPDMNESETQPIPVEDQPTSVLCVTSTPRIMAWDPSQTMVDMLKHHAIMGDVQTSASVLLALGERRRSLVSLDEATQEHWLLGYLDTLSRHQLWEIATQVIQLAWVPTVSQLNQQSTTVHTCCAKCGKPLLRAGWLCDRCHCAEAAACSVCHQVVRGLYAWCQGCAHGGHLFHMQEWWMNNKQCPTGCGHICEYS